MKDINEYFAEKCGVEILSRGFQDNMWRFDGNESTLHESRWDIKRADCREIIREKVHVETFRFGGGWRAENWKAGTLAGEGKGKTIAEAEINCLTAIYEAEEES